MPTQYTVQQMAAVWGWSGTPGESPMTWVRILDYKVSTLQYADQFPVANGGGVAIDPHNSNLALESRAMIQSIQEFLDGLPMNLMLHVRGDGALLYNWSPLLPLDPDEQRVMEEEIELPVEQPEEQDPDTKG